MQQCEEARTNFQTDQIITIYGYSYVLFYRILNIDVVWTVSSSLNSFIFFFKKTRL